MTPPGTGRHDAGGGTGHRCGWSEQSVGWALHALEPEQELGTETHLGTCWSCQELVTDTHEVMTRWITALPSVIPSPRLGQQLRKSVATTPQQHNGTPTIHAGNGPAPSVPTGATLSLVPAVSPHAWRARWAGLRARKRLPVLLAGAGVIIVFAAILAAVGVTGALGEAHRRGAPTLAGGTPTLLEQVSRGGAAHAMLRNRGGVVLVAVVLAPPGLRALTSSALPTPTRGVYVLWGTGTRPPIPLAILTATASGSEQLIPIGPRHAALTGYALSLEPGPYPPPTPSMILASGQLTE